MFKPKDLIGKSFKEKKLKESVNGALKELKKQKSKKGAVNFICPICNGKKYSFTFESNGLYGPGGRTRITNYVCDHCGVKFDPKKFSKKK